MWSTLLYLVAFVLENDTHAVDAPVEDGGGGELGAPRKDPGNKLVFCDPSPFPATLRPMASFTSSALRSCIVEQAAKPSDEVGLAGQVTATTQTNAGYACATQHFYASILTRLPPTAALARPSFEGPLTTHPERLNCPSATSVRQPDLHRLRLLRQPQREQRVASPGAR